MTISPSLMSAARQDWETPWDLFKRLQRAHGFTLDVAADATNAKLDRWLGPGSAIWECGLTRGWENERVFCNPPYGRHVGQWLYKANDEVREGCPLAVLLLPARVDTKWFQQYAPLAHVCEFIGGRLKFEGAEASAPFPSCLLTFREPLGVPMVIANG